ncbi:MAG: phosphoglycerate kinase [Candidatus Binatia bacterium]
MIRPVDKLDLKDKRVFVRVDFNVPLCDGKITETHRIDETLPTLRLVLAKAKKVVVASHLGRPSGKKQPSLSLMPVRDHLERSLSCPVILAPDCIGPEVETLVRDERKPKVVLLENLRFHREEEANDPIFSKSLASLAEAYVNDAFGAAHRAHASTSGVVNYFQEKGVGLLFKKELEYLGRILSSPQRPLVALLGGAKVSDKIGVLQILIQKVDSLLVGGGMAYTFLKARGTPIGKSMVEEDRLTVASELAAQSERRKVCLLLPTDHVTAENIEDTREPIISEDNIPTGHIGLDIGPKTIARFIGEMRKAKMVLWNGPMGLFEKERFSNGTRSIAKALAECEAISIVAGGETVAAVRQAGVGDKMNHLSTGGGATLEFLEGKNLPGIQALEESI